MQTRALRRPLGSQSTHGSTVPRWLFFQIVDTVDLGDTHLHCNDTVSYTYLTLSYKLKFNFERQEIVLLRAGAGGGFPSS
ncbi:hypothetical protein E2C01_097062 [Portunus trituberculatus]|uniref:Uncharacterized protein n=1 Tax=Portunus trituberculatus TaxID=210409 RepID=A0A5B7K3H9_PORTR|nr:hypothetical protein [Portunus trituberculatus]